MIHGVRLENGRADWYRNRWVRTESFDKPFLLYNSDGTRNLHASRANTNVVNHAGKTLALVESSLPYQITNELETLGAYDFGGKLVDSMTAHPKICPRTGELHFFGYGSLTSPYVTYHRANASGELIINRGVDVPGLTMMHDFAMSAEHIVFMDLPLVFRLDIARNSPATCRTAGATITAPGSGCCAAMTHTVRSAGLRSTRATFFTSSTPSIRPQMMANLSCCKQLVIPSYGAMMACLDSTP